MQNAVFRHVRTEFLPHRKHISPATEPSWFMLCKISGFIGGDYEECRLLVYDVWLL
jgi:hypothetical protein